MSSNLRTWQDGIDLDAMRLPKLVRSQLQRARNSRSLASSAVDIEERVREALYGKTYYGTHRHVFTHLLGGRR